MSRQQELIEELLRSEKKIFRPVDELYETSTKNPIGLRLANIESAFNIIAACKFSEWPFAEPKEAFLIQACDAVRDYLSGPYTENLPLDRRGQFENSRDAESWFDFVQRGLFIGLAGNSGKTIQSIADWVTFNMQEDSGVEEVSIGINLLYEHICCLLRKEKLPANFMDRFEKGLGRKRKRNCFLGDMLIAVESRDETRFVASLRSFVGKWTVNTKYAYFDKLISVDASVLCGLWERLTGIELGAAVEERCIYVRRPH